MNKAVAYGVATVAVLGGAYLGAVVYSGNVMQREYEAALDKVEKTLPFLKIVDRQYDKGLFSATATVSLQLGCSPLAGESGAKPPTLTFRDRITHGPLPGFTGVGLARIDTQLVLPPETPEKLRQWLDSMSIRTAVGFDGGMNTRVDLPAGEIKDAEGRLNWQPMHFVFSMNGAHTAINQDFAVPEITFNLARDGETVSFKLANLRGESASEFVGDVLRGESANEFVGNMLTDSGSGTGSLDLLQVASSRGNMQFDLNQVKFSVVQKVDNGLLGSTTALTGAANLKVGGRDFKFDKIELQESMKRIHAPTLQKIVLGFWQELGGLCNKTPEDFAASVEKQQAALLFAMKDLLAYDPEYSVDKIAVTYEGHEGMLAYSVAAKGVTGEDLQQPDSRLMNKIIVKASSRVPLAWLQKIVEAGAMSQEQLDAMIDKLVKTGNATRDGDVIASAALFEGGQLTINGKPFDIGPLLGLAPHQQDDAEDDSED